MALSASSALLVSMRMEWFFASGLRGRCSKGPIAWILILLQFASSMLLLRSSSLSFMKSTSFLDTPSTTIENTLSAMVTPFAMSPVLAVLKASASSTVEQRTLILEPLPAVFTPRTLQPALPSSRLTKSFSFIFVICSRVSGVVFRRERVTSFLSCSFFSLFNFFALSSSNSWLSLCVRIGCSMLLWLAGAWGLACAAACA